MTYKLLLIFSLAFTTYLNGQGLEEINIDLQEIFDEIAENQAVNYSKAKSLEIPIQEILEDFALLPIENLSEAEERSMWVNAYNLIVISEVCANQPIQSVKRIKSFFQKKHTIAGQSLSLDAIEKKLVEDQDERIHFALICGAKSCPPFPRKVFPFLGQNDYLTQLTKEALVSPKILSIEKDRILISQLFRWNADEFGDSKTWIQKYLEENIQDKQVDYLEYDWTLNQSKTLSSNPSTVDPNLRYFSSRLYEKGQYEVNLFSNYYTQYDPGTFRGTRSNFYTTTLQYLRGFNSRLNLGIDFRIRSVSSGREDFVSKWDALNFGNEGVIDSNNPADGYRRIGLTAIGLRAKYQPLSDVANLSFQHTLYLPTIGEAEGGSQGGFLDWGAPSFLTDFFYDQEMGRKGSIFIQVSAHLENINNAFLRTGDGYYQFSTPISVIYNYFASKKSTFYFLINAAPKWGYNVSNEGENRVTIPDSYNQYGMGFKYFVLDDLQAEVLYTKFYTAIPERSAATFNFGVRYFAW